MIRAFLCLLGAIFTSLGAMKFLSQAGLPSQPWWGFWAYLWLAMFSMVFAVAGIYSFVAREDKCKS